MNNFNWILQKLPYRTPFLFVDDLEELTPQGAVGYYTFRADSYFYEGHFKDHPVTPGVILTECCAQIGLVSLGIYLLGEKESLKDVRMGMSSAQMEFLKPVLPGERVKVSSELVYFRFQKLKCKVTMHNQHNQLVCKGVLAGMIGTSDE